MTDDLTKPTVKRGVDCIGVTISFVCHDGAGKVLLHKRSINCRDEHGRWDCGGGALEFGETFEDGLRREIREEYCVDVADVVMIGVANVLRQHDGMPTHWINIAYAVKIDPALARMGEPHKMDDIGWFTCDAMPSPLHSMLSRGIAMAQEKGIL